MRKGSRRQAPLSAGAAALVAATTALMTASAPAPAAAQQCALAVGTGVEVTAGAAAYDVAGGLDGPTLGAGAALNVGRASLRGDYEQVGLDGPDPEILRLAGALPLPLPFLARGGTALCAVAHAGATMLTVDRESSSVLAAGAGLRLSRPFDVGAARAHPYAELRGLWGQAGGTLLGVELGGSGVALGGEVGLRASIGRLTVAVTGSADGFSSGLGLTPYPTRTARAAVGVRF
jgi:hypothetical protein